MKVIYVNYSDINYRENQNNLIDYARRNNLFDGFIPYTREWLVTKDFYKENKNILDKDRLAGYTIWKPYIILQAFESIDDGDVVVYMDCGDVPGSKLKGVVYDYLQTHDQYLLEQYPQNIHRWFTKRDCFVYMDCDEQKYWNGVQLEGGFMAFKKNKYNIDFLEEYLQYCTDERIVTDIPNQCGLENFHGYQGHRHDQSVITNLQIKYDLPKVVGHDAPARNSIKWNALYHKDGEKYSNGSYDWGETGCLK